MPSEDSMYVRHTLYKLQGLKNKRELTKVNHKDLTISDQYIRVGICNLLKHATTIKQSTNSDKNVC